jgi:hypothetical protein
MCREPGLNHYGEIGIASSDHEAGPFWLGPPLVLAAT